MANEYSLARRSFLTTAVVGGASLLAAAQIGATGTSVTEKRGGAQLKLSLACGHYDRMVPLYSGEVQPNGIELNCIKIENPREVFDRMGKGEFDVSEFGATEMIIRQSSGKCPFVAIPVFPSRAFRHGFITINRKANIRTGKDFEGKRIGVPLYRQAAALYIRGLLQHEYGVNLETIKWVQGAVNQPGAHGDAPLLPLLKPVNIEANRSGKSLNTLLEEGALDAILGSSVPHALGRNPDIVRFFPDFQRAEREYYKRTGIYPIMHLVAIRREVYEQNPWVAASLFNAMNKAKNLALDRMRNEEALPYMMPWMAEQLNELRAVFGNDPWPYGVEPNRKTLEAMMSYLVEQGFIPTAIPLEKVFVT